MSYYAGDYYRNPIPYTSFDFGEPVPGWGVDLKVAGPQRVGVGALGLTVGERMAQSSEFVRVPGISVPVSPQPLPSPDPYLPSEPSVEGGMPSWLLPAVAVAGLGALGFYGTKKGWF